MRGGTTQEGRGDMGSSKCKEHLKNRDLLGRRAYIFFTSLVRANILNARYPFCPPVVCIYFLFLFIHTYHMYMHLKKQII